MKAIVGCLCDPILHVMIIAVVLVILAIQGNTYQASTTSDAGPTSTASRSAVECFVFGEDRIPTIDQNARVVNQE